MMKYDEPQKITALGVVIFSFFSLVIVLIIAAVFGGLSSLLVLKTNLPESFLKVGSVLGGGLGTIVAAAFLTAAGKVKGIVSAAFITAAEIVLKMVGNTAMDMGGYFSLNGLIGIVFIMLFSLAGGILGTMIRKR